MQSNKQSNKTELLPIELERQVQTIIQFLQTVHPSLVSDDAHKSCVEIRPIARGEASYELSRSCNIWDLSDTNVTRLRAFLSNHNGAPTCLFYSVFSYDNNMKAMTKTGKMAKPGKITTAAAVETNEIALDFDNIGFYEYTQLVDRFEKIGLYAMWVSTGHGFHAHLLLKSALNNKNILRELVYKFRAKGFDCDAACIDPARVMRLPGTFNKKYLVDTDYAHEANDPPRCEIYQNSTQRYEVEEILEALDRLPTVSVEDEELYDGVIEKSVLEPKLFEEGTSESVDVLNRIEYPYLSDYDLPEAVQKILSYTPKGYRNKCHGFLIKFLRDYFKLGRDELLEVLELWAAEACVPAYDKREFKTDFSRFYYNYGGLSYTPELSKKFGTIDFQGFFELRKKDIVIPNKLFRSFDKLDGTAVRLYLGIKMLEHREEAATQEALSELLSVSTRALRPTIQALEKSSFIYRVDGNRKLGIPFSYKTSKITTKTDGYMIFSYNDIKAYVTELYEKGNRAHGALKLFLLFRYKFQTKDVYMSQENLGKLIGVQQTGVSAMVHKLEELHFIKIKKKRHSFFTESCEYILLR